MSSTALRRSIRRSVDRKLARLRNGGVPTLLDLFSGCGGISLGFERAGFSVVGGVERDPDAAKSFEDNFRTKRKVKPRCWLTEGALDITRTDPVALARKAGVDLRSAVDVLVGGPPCQAFARIGRAKLRSVTKDPEAWLNDSRVDLYKAYLRFVAAFSPCAIMMENVPDFLTHGGENMAEEACSNLESLGYRAWYTLMNASFWGIPQHRERMILVAIHRSVDGEWEFPVPTHRAKPPSGYKGARFAAMAHVPEAVADETRRKGSFVRFVTPPDSKVLRPRLPPAVSVSQGIGDLPDIPWKEIGPRFSRTERTWSYRRGKPSSYAEVMRSWSDHTRPSDRLIRDHLTRYLPRDFPIFASMKHGEEYPAMHDRQMEKRDRKARRLGIRKGTKRWEMLTAKMVPPYPRDKFPNKWWRLDPDLPARTLLAHLGKDGYTHIHPKNPRVISVREAARLQSFPDGFRFSGAMNSMFRQIGNAVPPLLAYAVAKRLQKILRHKPRSAGKKVKRRK